MKVKKIQESYKKELAKLYKESLSKEQLKQDLRNARERDKYRRDRDSLKEIRNLANSIDLSQPESNYTSLPNVGLRPSQSTLDIQPPRRN